MLFRLVKMIQPSRPSSIATTAIAIDIPTTAPGLLRTLLDTASEFDPADGVCPEDVPGVDGVCKPAGVDVFFVVVGFCDGVVAEGNDGVIADGLVIGVGVVVVFV